MKRNFRAGLLEKYKFKSSKANVNINSIDFPICSMFFLLKYGWQIWFGIKFCFYFLFTFRHSHWSNFKFCQKLLLGVDNLSLLKFNVNPFSRRFIKEIFLQSIWSEKLKHEINQTNEPVHKRIYKMKDEASDKQKT